MWQRPVVPDSYCKASMALRPLALKTSCTWTTSWLAPGSTIISMNLPISCILVDRIEHQPLLVARSSYRILVIVTVEESIRVLSINAVALLGRSPPPSAAADHPAAPSSAPTSLKIG